MVNPELLSFEFQPAQQEVLTSFAERIGNIVVRNVSSDYFSSIQNDYISHKDRRTSSYPRKEENVATFGVGNNEEYQNYSYKTNQNRQDYDKGPFKSVSPTRDQNYKLQNEKYADYNPRDKLAPRDDEEYYYKKGQKHYEREYDEENVPKSNYTPIMPYNRQNKDNYRDTEQDYQNYRGESNYENYKNGIYDNASYQVQVHNYHTSSKHRNDEVPDREIENIKSNYAFENTSGQNIQELYESYKKQVI